jgi:antitoxin YefM
LYRILYVIPYSLTKMKTINYTDARNRLTGLLDEVESSREPAAIHRKGHEDIVVIPAADLSGLLETLHLLRSRANAKRLFESISDSYSGKTEKVTLDDLKRIAGLPD